MSETLVRAVKARVPLVFAKTTDFIYPATTLKAVLKLSRILRGEFTPHGGLILRPDRRNTVMFASMPPTEVTVDWADAYRRLNKLGATLILIGSNPEERPAGSVYAGELLPTDEMLDELFVEHEVAESDTEECVRALHGLSYQEALTVLRLAEHLSKQRQSATGDTAGLLLVDLRDARATLYGDQRGLIAVSTRANYYEPAAGLRNWVGVDGQLFKRGDTPELLVPRGLLFTGRPGTGKTAAAKYLARELDVPLFMLGLGDVLSRWQGEAEQNMAAVLRGAELRAPCVLLLDEAEKLFAERGAEANEGVSERLLATLLWWLQEHKTRVLTIMTTNDRDALPPELIRPGRIDRVMVFNSLSEGHAIKFVERLCVQMADVLPASAVPKVEDVAALIRGTGSEYTPAQLEAMLLERAKHQFVRS